FRGGRGRGGGFSQDNRNQSSQQGQGAAGGSNTGNASNRRIDWNEIRRNLEVCPNGKLSSRVEEIIKARADVFAVNDDDLGRLKNVSKTAVARFEEEERKRKIEEQIVEDRILKQWSDDQSKDEWVVSMLEKVKEVEKGKREITEEVTVPGSTKRTSLADWVVHKGVLYLLGTDHERRLYVPEGRRDQFVEDLHNSPLSGHLGTKKLVQKILNEAFWGSTCKDVQSVLRKCERCLQANAQKKMIPPLQPIVVNYPMEVVGIDLIDMSRGKNGGKYILSVINHFTKFAGAFVLKDKKAESVAESFMNNWVLQGGRTPKNLMSDNGTEFVNQVMAEIAKRFEIERRLTLPYHSRANGLTERFNRTIVEIMRRIKMRDDEWEEALPFALYAYNASPHGATGETPAFLMYGRDEKLPCSQIPQANPLYTVDMDVDEYKRRMCWMMERARGTVVAKLETERRKMKENFYDKHKHNMKVKPVPGDRVYLRVEAKMGDVRKIMDNYEGPYRIIATSSTTARVVRADDGLESGREKDERVVQWDRLRLVPREEEEEVEVCMVECNVDEGKEMNDGHFRTRVKLGSILHPDGICKTCRPMKIGDTKLVEDPMLAPWKDKKFSSLRELAAFIDRKEQSKKLDSWELSKAIDESCLEKDVTTFSLKMAYRKGMCPCACDLARQVAMFGVEFEEEETRISDAISEVLARSGKRSSRKKMVVLIPDDSVITTCGGSFREAEGMKYADETEMRKILSDMKGKNLPESLVVLLKKSLGDSMLKLVKKNLLVLAKEEDISIYVTTDLLPKKSDLYTQESINALQEWLVLWNSEKKQKNIMIMSPVSGLLEKTYALAMLFPVARKESKWLFEQAVRYIVYGEVLP
ncbi:hypothetical protein PMAYCL1PPCAC_20169, partial [Pristionchus mayeri]